jgi:ParB/RepB/Spo0J family partition protein
MEETFVQIPLDKIVPSHTNPRNHADYKKEDLVSLAQSIKESGLIQPVRVRPHFEKNGFYELIIGERRYRAHQLKESGKTTIDAIVCDYDDTQVVVAQNIENIQRKDVHAMDEAKSLKSLLDLIDPKTKTNRYTVESLAAEIGKSKSYVWQTIVLVGLIEPFQVLFRQDKISKQIAMMLARQTEEQQRSLVGYIEDELNMNFALDPDDIEFHIKREYHLELSSAPFDKKDADLLPAAGPCTTCAKSTANAPDLFGDLGKAARCTDSACFKLKKEALFERNIKKLRQSGETFVIVNNDRPGSKNVLGGNEVKPAKAGDKGAVQAIHTDSDRRGAMEWVKPKRIPMNDEQKEGGKKSAPKPKKKELSYEERARLEKQQCQRSLRILQPIAEEILLKVPDSLPQEVHEWIVKTIVDTADGFSDLFQALIGKREYADIDKMFKHLVSKLSKNQLLHLGFLMSSNEFSFHYDGEIPKSTWKLCEALGIDWKSTVKKMEQLIKDEEKTPKPGKKQVKKKK